MDLERTARVHSVAASDQTLPTLHTSAFENGMMLLLILHLLMIRDLCLCILELSAGNLTRKLSSASSLGSMEESYFLQASLDSSDSLSERRNAGEAIMSPYYMKSMTPSAFEAALRQKEGELASYMSRLVWTLF